MRDFNKDTIEAHKALMEQIGEYEQNPTGKHTKKYRKGNNSKRQKKRKNKR